MKGPQRSRAAGSYGQNTPNRRPWPCPRCGVKAFEPCVKMLSGMQVAMKSVHTERKVRCPQRGRKRTEG